MLSMDTMNSIIDCKGEALCITFELTTTLGLYSTLWSSELYFGYKVLVWLTDIEDGQNKKSFQNQ